MSEETEITLNEKRYIFHKHTGLKVLADPCRIIGIVKLDWKIFFFLLRLDKGRASNVYCLKYTKDLIDLMNILFPQEDFIFSQGIVYPKHSCRKKLFSYIGLIGERRGLSNDI